MTRTIRDYHHDDALDWYDSLSEADRADYDVEFRKTAQYQIGQFVEAVVDVGHALWSVARSIVGRKP